MKGAFGLSTKEQRRLAVLQQLDAGKLSTGDAARLLRISRRQLRRLRAVYQESGAAALVHGNRGRRPVNAIDPASAERVLALATSHRGASLQRLTELLAEEHGIRISRASVHRILRRASEIERATGAPDSAPAAEGP